MTTPNPGFPPRLVALVVIVISLVFLLTSLVSLWANRRVDPELYGLMGLVAGAVLGIPILKNRKRGR